MSAFENMEKVYDPSQSEQQTYEAWETLVASMLSRTRKSSPLPL